jgi:hypothetical protein
MNLYNSREERGGGGGIYRQNNADLGCPPPNLDPEHTPRRAPLTPRRSSLRSSNPSTPRFSLLANPPHHSQAGGQPASPEDPALRQP